MKKRESQHERRQKARQSILTATLELVAERGVDGFAFADIADRAGVSRGLPGFYFQSREALFNEVAEMAVTLAGESQVRGNIDRRMQRNLARVITPGVRQRAMVAFLSHPAHRARAQRYLATWGAVLADEALSGKRSSRTAAERQAFGEALVASLLGQALAGAIEGGIKAEARHEAFKLALQKGLPKRKASKEGGPAEGETAELFHKQD